MATSIDFGNSVIDTATQYGQSQAPFQEMPFWINTLENIPAATAVAGNFARRGANTILAGGGYRGTGQLEGGWVRRGFANNNPLRMRNWGRFESADQMLNMRTGRGTYNPYVIAQAANGLTNSARGGILSRRAPQMASRMREFAGDDMMMQGGFLGRVTAAGRVGRMSDARWAKYQSTGGLPRFLGAAGITDDAAQAAMSSRGTAQRAILTSTGGAATGYMGGFLSAFTEGAEELAGTGRAGNVGRVQEFGKGTRALGGFNRARGFADDLGLQMGRGLKSGRIITGTTTAMRAASGLGAAARVGGKGAALLGGRLALMASPLAPLMTAWMAYDLAKIGVQAIGKGAQVAAQGYRSFQGGLNTRVMDPGFQDTEASMTSRSRGVMAIQNSRLNARSVLGAEASGMASHFG